MTFLKSTHQHPDTLRKNSKGKVNDEIINYQNQLKGLEIEIYKYSDYPILFSKLSSLKEYWKRVIPLWILFLVASKISILSLANLTTDESLEYIRSIDSLSY